MKNSKTRLVALLFSTLCLLTSVCAQITPSADSYTNTADPTTNYGAKTLLDVESSQTTYIQFNLSSIPSSYTGADITQATLKLYVNAVTTAGSLNVDYVNGTWSESKITADNAPALGSTIAASVALVTADKNQYILIDITSAVQAWLNGSQANDGIALTGNSPVNASFDSKENTTTSHPAELDIVFVGGGTITGVTTASGSGLTGGGTSGTLNLSLLTSCSSGQVEAWSGSAWVCASAGTGTITGVTTSSGSGLTGGGSSGTLNLSLVNTCGTGQVLAWSGSAWVCTTPSGSTALSSITSPIADTSIATGTFPTTFTEGDFGSSPVGSAFGITDTATSTTDNSFDLTVENGNNSFHNPFSTGVTTGGTYFPQLQICNNGSGHVGASLFGNTVTCGTLSTAPYNKVTITDNTAAHTGLAILNNASAETGTMLRLLSATPTTGSYNFLTACAGTTAADKLCNGTIVAALTASGELSVAASVTAPEFCIGSSCITSWPGADIEIGNQSAASNSGAIRIGASSTQSPAFIAGIYGVTTSANDAVPVLIDSSGNLGIISSSQRYEEDIRDMEDASAGLMRLRPVTFRYKKPYNDGSQPMQYGLIAEEVAELYPDLVVRSADGQIETVKYQVLGPMLLNELQKQSATIAAQKEEIRSLEERLARMETALEGVAVYRSVNQ